LVDCGLAAELFSHRDGAIPIGIDHRDQLRIGQRGEDTGVLAAE